MKSFNVDRDLINLEVIKRAIVTVCKSKRKRPHSSNGKFKHAQLILANLDEYADRVLEMVLSFERVQKARESGLIPRKEDLKRMYVPRQCRPFKIRDAGSGKERMIISVPIFPDQIMHQLIIEAAKPVFMRSMYEYSLGSVPGGGIHKGKRYLERTIRRHRSRDKSAIKYAALLDIQKCYPSISHAKLKAGLRKKFRGKLFIWLCGTVIDSYHDFNFDGNLYGIPLGYSTSHWFCNFYLTPLDHFIKNELRVDYYVRYMDDIVFFGSNKKRMHSVVREIMKFTSGLELRIKSNWQVFRFDYFNRFGERRGRDIDVLGFRFFRDKTILRKRLALSISRAARRTGKKKPITPHAAMSLMSRLGWLRHCNSFNFYLNNVGPYVNIRKLKGVIRNESRKQHQAKTTL